MSVAYFCVPQITPPHSLQLACFIQFCPLTNTFSSDPLVCSHNLFIASLL